MRYDAADRLHQSSAFHVEWQARKSSLLLFNVRSSPRHSTHVMLSLPGESRCVDLHQSGPSYSPIPMSDSVENKKKKTRE